MAAVELATGYVSLAVETSDVAKQVGRMFTGVEGSASKAGKSMGQAMSKGFAQQAPDVDALAAEVERAQKKITAQVEASARKQEAAARKVEIAQAKVAEATERYGDKSSQSLTAVDRLATAQQKLESETMSAADAQRKLVRDLDDAEQALSEAEEAAEDAGRASGKASTEYAKGWKGVGQRVKTYLSGGVKDATEDAEDVAERGGRETGGKFGSAFKGAIAGVVATVSIREIAQGIGAAVTGAGELQQSVGAIDAVFKGSADQMHAWSSEAASAVGLSKNEYNELGTLIGAQLKNGGTAMDELGPKTNELIGLGADLSSMFGGDAATAVEALSSALKGERDPIEKYGVTLNQAKIDAEAAALGFEKVGGSLSSEANQAATLSLIMKQTTDAHGNFAAESDTFAHKQQVAAAQWEDLTGKIGELFLPIMTDAMGFLSDKAMPIVENIIGGVETFGAAWSGTSDDVEKSGFQGFMADFGRTARTVFDYFRSNVFPVLQDFGKALWDNRAILIVAAAAIGTYFAITKTMAAYTAIHKWYTAMTLGQRALNLAMKANPIGIVVTALAALVAGLIWAYNNVEWFRVGVQAAWAGIQTAVNWAWVNVIQPVFNALVGFVRDVLGPIFSWLWNSIIAPVFGWIGARIKGVWEGVIKPVFDLLWGVITNVVGPAITDLWNGVVKPAFKGIGDFIDKAWRENIKPVLDVFAGFISDHVAPGIEKGIGFIRDAWAKVKRFFAEPINWVIRTVWNNGIKKAFDAVAEAVGIDSELGRIREIPLGDSSTKGNRAGTGGRLTAGRAASGGHLQEDRPYLVGELGPEMVWPNREAFVSTAVQTRQLLAQGKDLTPGQSRKAAGRNPSEAVAPMGDFNWGTVGDELKRRLSPGSWLGTDQMARGGEFIVGNLAKAATSLIDSAVGGMNLGGSFGDLLGGAAKGWGKSVVDWAAGHDKSAMSSGGGALTFNGPLGSTTRPHGPITSHFGMRWGRRHDGTDWGGGGAIRSFWDGIVRKVAWNAATGRTGIGTIIDHAKGLSSYYGHQAPGSPTVKRGDVVKSGQIIGQRGLTGNTTGLHLHGEVWKNGTPVNPLGYLHDKGGWHQPGTYSYNGLREPEAVLTPEESKAFKALAEAAATNVEPRGTGGGIVFNQEVHGVDAFEAAALAREQTAMELRMVGI